MKELLRRVGWSQRYFSRYLGVSEDTVNHWCTGVETAGSKVAIKFLERVARDLGV